MWIRPTEGKQFLETLELVVDSTAPLSMVFKLAIGIEGKTPCVCVCMHACLFTGPEPDSWSARERGHHSLPQPLHLRVTYKDDLDRSASVRMEQVSNNTCILHFVQRRRLINTSSDYMHCRAILR